MIKKIINYIKPSKYSSLDITNKSYLNIKNIHTTNVINIDKINNYFSDKNLKTDSKIFDYIINLDGESYREVKSKTIVRSTIRVDLANSGYFIKKHFPIPASEYIKNIINFKSPYTSALSEGEAIMAVRDLNIKTLDIAAYGVKNNKYKSTTSYIITKAIEPSISLDKVCEKLLENKYYFKFKRAIIKFIAETTRKLHINGLNHRDYYLCHYLLDLKSTGGDLSEPDLNLGLKDFNIKDFNLNNSCSNDDKAQDLVNSQDCGVIHKILSSLSLIDLHRMQIRKKVPQRYIIKDLSAILFSARDLKLTKADKLRFIKYYMGISDKNKFKLFMLKENKFWQKVQGKASSLREKG